MAKHSAVLEGLKSVLGIGLLGSGAAHSFYQVWSGLNNGTILLLAKRHSTWVTGTHEPFFFLITLFFWIACALLLTMVMLMLVFWTLFDVFRNLKAKRKPIRWQPIYDDAERRSSDDLGKK